MSDNYTESQANRIEEDAYNGAIFEAGKEWERRRDESNLREHELQSRIAELEGDREKAFDLVRKLRMYCIWANWDNPDTEDEFNEFDVEVCKWLSKFMEREE